MAYTVVPAKIDLNDINGRMAFGARESSKMDWSDYDRADETSLNSILWHSIKGAKSPMPAPTRSVAVMSANRSGRWKDD